MPVPKPASEVEAEIFEFFKEYDPASAYLSGLKEYGGRLFIPSKRNLERFSHRVEELRLKAENESQLKLLDSLSAIYTLGEPEIVAEYILNTYFGYMIKEGIVPSRMRPLTRNAVRAMEAAVAENSHRRWPTGLRILTLIRCQGIQEIIRTIRKENPDKQLKKGLDDLAEATRKYASIFQVKGFKNQSFDDVYKIIKREGCELGREKIYAQSLRRLYDYPESPAETEEKGLRYLKRELPRFQRLTKQLSKKYNISAKAEEVSKTLRAKRSIKPDEVVPFLTELRKRAIRVVHKAIVRVNPKYETRVIETPPYLSGIVPSGAAYFYDTFTSKPQQIFMTTTDPRRDPHTVPGELLNLLVHEEYGHCVHGSNSAFAFAAKPTLTDMLWSPLGAISEGISFQRELEFQKVMEKLQNGKGLDRDEEALAQFLEKYGGLAAIAEEYEFFTRMWRIIRFLRIIGDVRINSGKQDLVDFIEWAHKETGLSKSTVYHQLFPAHQGIGPGYASTYAIIGESIREIQSRAVRNGRSLLDFNTYACSMGFPARTVFEERLRAFATR